MKCSYLVTNLFAMDVPTKEHTILMNRVCYEISDIDMLYYHSNINYNRFSHTWNKTYVASPGTFWHIERKRVQFCTRINNDYYNINSRHDYGITIDAYKPDKDLSHNYLHIIQQTKDVNKLVDDPTSQLNKLKEHGPHFVVILHRKILRYADLIV